MMEFPNIVLGVRTHQGFLRGSDERTKGMIVLYLGLVRDLASFDLEMGVGP